MESYDDDIAELRANGEEEACIITKEPQDEGGGSTMALIRFSSSPGAWSGFWTIDDVKDGTTFNILPEYDFEHCGSWIDRITATLHWGKNYEDKKQTSYNRVKGGRKFRPTKYYYIYEFDWNPYRLKWKINGLTVRYERRGISTNARRAILSCGFGDYCVKPLSSLSEPTSILWFVHKKDK